MDQQQTVDIGLRGYEYFLCNTGDPCSTIPVSVFLKDEVLPEHLQSALEQALRRNWAFRVAFFFDEKGRIRFKNHTAAPVVLRDEGKTCHLGSEETAGYLFVLLYDRNRITLRVFHGLTDAKGTILFLQSVLYYYLKELGKPVSADEVPFILDHPEEASEHALSYEDTADAHACGASSDEHELFTIPEPYMPGKEKWTRSVMLTAPIAPVLDYARQSGATLTAVIMAAMGRIILEGYEVGDREIRGICTVNKRPLWQVNALANFSSNVVVPFREELHSLPFAEQCAGQSRLLKELNTREEHAALAFRALQYNRMLPEYPARMMAEKVNQKEFPAHGTYLISNLGRISFGPAIDRELEKIDFQVPPMQPNIRGLAVFATSFGQELMIALGHCYRDNPIAGKLKEQLESLQIPVQLTDYGWITGDSLDYAWSELHPGL